MAGDIHRGTKAIDFIKAYIERFSIPVVYVLGNHEFYYNDYEQVKSFWKNVSLEIDGLHVLDNQSVVIENVVFLGATLWTDFQTSPKKGNQGILRNMLIAQMLMNDYKLVQYKKQLLQPQDTRQFHIETMEWLTKELNSYQQQQEHKNDDSKDGNKTTNYKKICIVSHHLPSYKSISKQFKNSPLNPAFASKLGKTFIQKYNNVIHTWIHGHTHEPCDYRLGKTRIVCNPRGYEDEDEHDSFDSGYVIEI